MEGIKIASRYAQSLLDLSEERKVTDVVLDNMKALIEVSNEREFNLFLASPLIKADKKSQVLDRLFSNFDELTIKFIHLLTRNNREKFLPLIASEFIDKVNQNRGVVSMKITSAVKLDDQVKATILNKLNSKINGKVELTETVDESIIGGFVARMGDTQIDASVSSQLKEMKKRLIG